jgi:hypothetical protein
MNDEDMQIFLTLRTFGTPYIINNNNSRAEGRKSNGDKKNQQP